MSRTVYAEAVITIAVSSSLSAAVPLGSAELEAVLLPAAWTAANVTFEGSMDGVIFGSIYDGDAGTETEYKLTTTYTAATGAVQRVIAVNPQKFRGFTHIKVRSGTQGTPVVQAANRTIQLGLRDI